MSEDMYIERASPEMRFLLSCLRTREQVAVADKPLSGVDWEKFIKLCRVHRCVPLVQKYLHETKNSGSSAVPSEVMVSLKMLATKIAICNIRLTETLCDIQELLVRNDIRSACVKGPALSILAYGNTTMRQFGDLDLLVSSTDMERTIDLLLARGYELRGLSSRVRISSYVSTLQDVTFQNRDRTVYLDLGSVLISHILSSPAMGDFVLANARELQIDDKRHMQSPGAELMMMVVCMHGAQDMWDKLSFAADVAALLEFHSAVDWNGILTIAEGWGQKRSVLEGMGIAHKLLDTHLPEEIYKALEADSVAAGLVDEAVQGLLSESLQNEGMLKRKIFEYRTRERTKDKLRWLIRQTFIPSANEYNLVRLPTSLNFLYYLLRPVRLLMRTGDRGPFDKSQDKQ